MVVMPRANFKLSKSRREQISHKLAVLQMAPDWVTGFDKFAKETIKEESWKTLITGLLSVLGFPMQDRPRAWAQRVQLLVVSINQASLDLAQLLPYAYEHTFEPDNADGTAVVPIDEFDKKFIDLVQQAQPELDLDSTVCPHCAKARIHPTAKFCFHCGTMYTEAADQVSPTEVPNAGSQGQSPDLVNALSAITSTLSAQTKFLQQLSVDKRKPYFCGADDQLDDQFDENEISDATAPSLWREPICTSQECARVVAQHNCGLQQYLERSMVTTAELIQKLKGMKSTFTKEDRSYFLTTMSKSLRDQLMSYHAPGSRPMEEERKALCCSMLKGRLPAKEREKVASNKPKFIPPRKDEKANENNEKADPKDPPKTGKK